MLSVRLEETIEKQLTHYCTEKGVSKTHVVQEALTLWLSDTKPSHFLKADDPLVKWVGAVKSGKSTDELMRATRGDDWTVA